MARWLSSFAGMVVLAVVMGMVLAGLWFLFLLVAVQVTP